MVFRLKSLNLDEVCRRLLITGNPGWLAIKSEFGDKRFFRDSGELDRKSFRCQIFSDSALRKRVDRCLHPLVKAEMDDICKNGSCATWLVEIPLLFEAGWQDEVDTVIVVDADIETRITRIMARDGVSEGETLRAINGQKPMEEKIERADFVIKNDGAWPDTCLQVLSIGRLVGRKY